MFTINPEIQWSMFSSVESVEPVPQRCTLQAMANFFTLHSPEEVEKSARKTLFSMNIYHPNTRRGTKNVAGMTGIVFDFDNKKEFVPIAQIIEKLDQRKIVYFWYTTHSHTTERPKWRLVIPFAKPLPVEEWSALYEAGVILIGSPPGIDHPASKDIARMWFVPYKHPEHEFMAQACLKGWLVDPVDFSLLLTSKEQAELHERKLKKESVQVPSSELILPVASLPKTDFTLQQVLRAISYLDASCNYDAWLKIGMALHHQFGGNPIAFNIWDIWSSQSEKYKNREDLASHWKSFGDKEKTISIGTLIQMAKEKGYSTAQRNKATEEINVKFLDILDFLETTFPPLEMLIEPIIPRRGLVMMYAPRGIGKTYLSLSIAYVAAAGKSMLNGKWKADRENKVLFIDGEMPAGRLQHRVKGLVRSVGSLSSAGLFKIFTPDIQDTGIPDLSREEGQKVIDKHLEGTDFLVLDNLSCLFRSGSENEAESWKTAQEWLLDLRRRGISVLLVHHANKTGDQRGTSKKEDLLDTVISLKRPEDYDPEEGARFEVHYEKARGFYGEEAKPFEVQLIEKEHKYFWEVKDLEDDELNEIITLYEQGLSIRNISKEVGLHRCKIERLLKKLKSQGKVQAHA